MKPVSQTVRGKLGNCFAACVASITELPLESLPNHFKNENGDVDARWLDEWNEALRPYGLGMTWADAIFSRTPAGYAIAEMEVMDHDSNHAVVCLNGEIIHDPLGEGYAFGRFVNWYAFTVLDAHVTAPAGPDGDVLVSKLVVALKVHEYLTIAGYTKLANDLAAAIRRLPPHGTGEGGR